MLICQNTEGVRGNRKVGNPLSSEHGSFLRP